jgi:hypothetical protein
MIRAIFSRSNVAFSVLVVCAVIAYRYTNYLNETEFVLLCAVSLLAFSQL